jgi:hypothetical protein
MPQRSTWLAFRSDSDVVQFDAGRRARQALSRRAHGSLDDRREVERHDPKWSPEKVTRSGHMLVAQKGLRKT